MNNTTQQALLVRGAVLGDAEPHISRTAIVTVNGHVTIVPVANPATGVQFTFEQWKAIVEFVQTADDGRWGPDWALVPPEFNYVAMDESGFIGQYGKEPFISEDVWIIDDSNWGYSDDLYAPDGLNWRKSLRKRPGS